MEVLAKSHQSHGHCCGHEHGEGGSLKNTLLLLGGALILTVAAASAPFPETVMVSVSVLLICWQGEKFCWLLAATFSRESFSMKIFS